MTPIQLLRGVRAPSLSLNTDGDSQLSLWHLVATWGVLGVISGAILHIMDLGFGNGMLAAFYVVLFTAALPLLAWVIEIIRTGVAPHAILNTSAVIQCLYGYAFGSLWFPLVNVLAPEGKQGLAMIVVGVICALIAPMAFRVLAGRRIWRGMAGATQPQAVAAAPATAQPQGPRPFSLTLGTSTGHFTNLGHGAGMAAGHPVGLALGDAATNIIIFGGIGSGKTTRIINSLLLQIMQQDAGALIFDIKTDFIRETDYLAHQAGRRYSIIGDGGLPFNLLQGLTPEVAASFLKSAFLMADSSGGNAFWVDGAVELCRNTLGLLQHFPEKYTLPGLYKFVFSTEEQTIVFEALEDLRAEMVFTEDDYRLIQTCLNYFETNWSTKEEREVNYLKSTVSQVLAPFQHPALIDAFCTVSDGQAQLEDLVNEGQVYLVEIPVTKFGREGSRLAYLFIKLRYMQMMKERNMRRGWNQQRPVVFFCDEYHEIIDPVSDLTFWDKSRSSKNIGVVSMQSVSSLLGAIKDEKVAHAILQNFREILCFRTEDEQTLKRYQALLGEVDVQRMSESQGSGTSDSKGGGSSSKNYSQSVSIQRQHVINAQLFRQLGAHQAVAILNIGGHAFDDVINCQSIFVPEGWEVAA